MCRDVCTRDGFGRKAHPVWRLLVSEGLFVVIILQLVAPERGKALDRDGGDLRGEAHGREDAARRRRRPAVHDAFHVHHLLALSLSSSLGFSATRYSSGFAIDTPNARKIGIGIGKIGTKKWGKRSQEGNEVGSECLSEDEVRPEELSIAKHGPGMPPGDVGHPETDRSNAGGTRVRHVERLPATHVSFANYQRELRSRCEGGYGDLPPKGRPRGPRIERAVDPHRGGA